LASGRAEASAAAAAKSGACRRLTPPLDQRTIGFDHLWVTP